MDLKPIYEMTGEELEEFHNLTDKETNEYLGELFEQEAEKFIEKMHKGGMLHVGNKDVERIEGKLLIHGAEGWLRLCDFPSDNKLVCWYCEHYSEHNAVGHCHLKNKEVPPSGLCSNIKKDEYWINHVEE